MAAPADQPRESRARSLYEFSRALSTALQSEQIFEITRNFVQRSFRSKAVVLLPDENDRLQLPAADAVGVPHFSVLDLGIAQWAFDRAKPAGIGTDTLPGNAFFYLPLVAPMRTRGVLAIQPEHRRWILIPEQRQQLEAARQQNAKDPQLVLGSGTTHSIRSEATLADGTRAVLRATIRLQAGQAQPYAVLRWQEGEAE